MDISTITNVLKLHKKAYFLGSFIPVILLFSDDSFLKRLSLLEFKENYILWIGVAFLLSEVQTKKTLSKCRLKPLLSLALLKR